MSKPLLSDSERKKRVDRCGDLKPGDKVLVEATIDVPPDENGIAQVILLLDDDCETVCIDSGQLRPLDKG